MLATLKLDSIERFEHINLNYHAQDVEVFLFEQDCSGVETGYRDDGMGICQGFCSLFEEVIRATLEDIVVFSNYMHFADGYARIQPRHEQVDAVPSSPANYLFILSKQFTATLSCTPVPSTSRYIP